MRGSCRPHDHCRVCAKACRRCEQACEALLTA
ncbi:four-helix bundle copper-binding protein [Iamia sp. SCSIO 61187]